MNLTEEQQQILKFDFSSHLKINAFAGTGKTTTLRWLAEANPDKKFLYIAFNKHIVVEAEQVFPYNVVCKTINSLAYTPIGAMYNAKNRFKHVIKPKDLELFTFQTDPKVNASVLKSLQSFYASVDKEPSDEHIELIRNMESSERPKILGMVQAIWEAQKNLNHRIPITHDTYVKLAFLDPPNWGFDAILIDEAQDITPIVHSAMLKQNVPLVIVGDAHQGIYEWRFTSNLMEEEIENCQSLSLTHSFRFPEHIATNANIILQHLKDMPENLIKGKGPNNPDEINSLAVLFRTNAALLWQAMIMKGKNIVYRGGFKKYTIELLPLYHLKAGNRRLIHNDHVRLFSSFSEYKLYGQQAHDTRMIWNASVVEIFYSHFLEIYHELELNAIPEEYMEPHHLLFTTAHSAKGCEWDAVLLADDFPIIIDERSNYLNGLLGLTQEANLIYMAITRAKQLCTSPLGITKFIARAKANQLPPKRNQPIEVSPRQPFHEALTEAMMNSAQATIQVMKKINAQIKEFEEKTQPKKQNQIILT